MDVWIIVLDGDIIGASLEQDYALGIIEDDAEERGKSEDEYDLVRVPLDSRTF